MSNNVFEKRQGVFGNGKTENRQAEVPVDESSQLGPLSRRKMLQYLGIQAVIGASVVKGAVAAPKNFNPKHYNREITPDQLPNTRAWLVTNPNACVGCRNLRDRLLAESRRGLPAVPEPDHHNLRPDRDPGQIRGHGRRLPPVQHGRLLSCVRL